MKKAANMEKMTIALLSGGVSSEREVSLNSGNQVYDALNKERYNIVRYDPKTDLGRLIEDAPGIDAALIILHGPYGEDGTVQGLLELLNIPYQGSGVLGSSLAMNKLASKILYEKAELPIPPYITLQKGDPLEPAAWEKQLGLPLVIKPNAAGSSVGMTIVKSQDAIQQAAEKAFSHDSTILLEGFIDGIELTAGVIGNRDLTALPIIEIIPNDAHEFFDYEAKYTAGVTQEICPARIDDEMTQKAQAYAMAAHRVLFCSGYSRTDMILKDAEIYVLETNTIPGMTATSLLPQAARAAGMSFSSLLDRLIELSLQAHQQSGQQVAR
jgi:D-alanine-D-alanine ligase